MLNPGRQAYRDRVRVEQHSNLYFVNCLRELLGLDPLDELTKDRTHIAEYNRRRLSL